MYQITGSNSVFCDLFSRSGSQKAQPYSIWSAACVWTARPPPVLQSSCSVAPRWPAKPGSHKSSPEPQTGRVWERGVKLDFSWTQEMRLWTVSLCRRMNEWGLYFCDVNFLLIVLTRQKHPSKHVKASWSKLWKVSVYSAPSSEGAAVVLLNQSFSLKSLHIWLFYVSVLVNSLNKVRVWIC